MFDAIDRLAHTETRSIDLEMNYRPNEQWAFGGRVGYTDAIGETEQQPFWETNAPTGFTFDFRNGVPAIAFTDIDPATADDEMALGWASNNRVLNDDNEFYVFGDVERFFDGGLGPFKSIKAGLKYTDHDREVDVTYGQRRGLLPWTGPGATACGGHPCSLADVAGGLTPDDFLDGIAGPGTLSRYLMADKDLIEADLQRPAAGRRLGIHQPAGRRARMRGPAELQPLRPARELHAQRAHLGRLCDGQLRGRGLARQRRRAHRQHPRADRRLGRRRAARNAGRRQQPLRADRADQLREGVHRRPAQH